MMERSETGLSARETLWLWLALASIALALRIALALHPGLWVDEIFSLAMATGHSLEHPAEAADPARGDYVEPRDAQAASVFNRYLQHDTPPAGPIRVIRAVTLSDTSPPLYYLLLNVWTRVAGTSDAALRLCSVVSAMACFPLLWSLGTRLGGRRTAWAACVLFACSPLAIYYSTEGRMYSLTWLLALLIAWSTVALTERGPRVHLLCLWVLASAGGLLTHYFLVFVLAPCVAWMLLYPTKISRSHIVSVIATTTVVVSPWYMGLPETLGRWRVTNGWLDHPLAWQDVVINPVVLAWNYVSVSGVWGRSPLGNVLILAVCASLCILAVRAARGELFSRPPQLLWLWVLGSTLGPVALDVLRGTNTSAVTRYALPGLPAAILLLALALSHVSLRAYAAFLVLIPLVWTIGLRQVYREPSRPWEPFSLVSNRVSAEAGPTDLVIVHSIPSGVIGVARYMNTATPIASWVVQLKQRQMPDDMERLVAGHNRVFLVKIHDLGEPSPAENWLSQNWHRASPAGGPTDFFVSAFSRRAAR